MTQHAFEEDTAQDKLIMRRLALVVGGFLAFTVLMAIAVGTIMG